MALFQKEDKSSRIEEPRPTPVSAAPAPSYEAAPRNEFQAVLGNGSRIEGRLVFDGSVRIDGQVDGEINCQETVYIGETAVVTAQIQAATVVLLGRLNGDIKASKRVELRAPGKLFGNIATPSLVIHEGVHFEGHCAMGGDSKSDRSDNKKVAILPVDRAASDSGS